MLVVDSALLRTIRSVGCRQSLALGLAGRIDRANLVARLRDRHEPVRVRAQRPSVRQYVRPQLPALANRRTHPSRVASRPPEHRLATVGLISSYISDQRVRRPRDGFEEDSKFSLRTNISTGRNARISLETRIPPTTFERAIVKIAQGSSRRTPWLTVLQITPNAPAAASAPDRAKHQSNWSSAANARSRIGSKCWIRSAGAVIAEFSSATPRLETDGYPKNIRTKTVRAKSNLRRTATTVQFLLEKASRTGELIVLIFAPRGWRPKVIAQAKGQSRSCEFRGESKLMLCDTTISLGASSQVSPE